MGAYDFKEKHKRNGELYYYIKINESGKKKLLRKLHRSGIKYRCVPEQWERSSDYRQQFFKENKPPYRCRYCNRKLSKDTLVVDHIIPVYAAKTDASARRLLKIRGMNSVNDTGNLTASCVRCNKQKGSKMGIWLVRAYLGKYRLYWAVKPVITLAAVCIVIWYLIHTGIMNDILSVARQFAF